MPQENSNSQRYIVIATLAFIVGFGLSWLISANKLANCFPSKTATSTSETADLGGEMTGVATTSDIVVPDQGAGTQVNIGKVVFEKSGWVVIHDNDGGQPGRILGAQLFDAGTWDGTVELLRGTLAGGKYFAMIHDDNGDRAFDPKKDLPHTDASGNPVMVEFTATGDSMSQ